MVDRQPRECLLADLFGKNVNILRTIKSYLDEGRHSLKLYFEIRGKKIEFLYIFLQMEEKLS